MIKNVNKHNIEVELDDMFVALDAPFGAWGIYEQLTKDSAELKLLFLDVCDQCLDADFEKVIEMFMTKTNQEYNKNTYSEMLEMAQEMI